MKRLVAEGRNGECVSKRSTCVNNSVTGTTQRKRCLSILAMCSNALKAVCAVTTVCPVGPVCVICSPNYCCHFPACVHWPLRSTKTLNTTRGSDANKKNAVEIKKHKRQPKLTAARRVWLIKALQKRTWGMLHIKNNYNISCKQSPVTSETVVKSLPEFQIDP